MKRVRIEAELHRNLTDPRIGQEESTDTSMHGRLESAEELALDILEQIDVLRYQLLGEGEGEVEKAGEKSDSFQAIIARILDVQGQALASLARISQAIKKRPNVSKAKTQQVC